jgi:hypothetical protein
MMIDKPKTNRTSDPPIIWRITAGNTATRTSPVIATATLNASP